MMRSLKKLTVAGAACALLVGAAACDNADLTGLNNNPNAPQVVGPDKLFPNAVSTGVNLVEGSSMQERFTELFSQHMAEYQYPDDDRYDIRSTTIDGYWNTFYATPLQDLAQILRQAKLDSAPKIAGPAIVMRGWLFQNVTDIWGDAPFTEANKGDQGITAPAYDAQSVIYDSLFTELAAAQAAMKGASNGSGYGATDLLYGGSMSKWAKFANSLRARLAMRLTKVDATRARSELEAAVAAGGFTSNADNAVLKWPGDGQNNNDYWVDINVSHRDDFRVSKTLADTLTALNDPRLGVYADPTQLYADSAKGPMFAGMPNGLSATEAGTWGYKSSRIGKFFKQANSPSMLMSYAEYEFILAEAAERGWTVPGTAQEHYDAAITASMQYYGIPAAQITTYLAQSRVALSGTQATALQQIALQKWIALFAQGVEAWSEYRRTNVPNLTAPALALTPDKKVPRRLTYSPLEQSLNGANLTAAIAGLSNGDAMNSRIWWDK